MTTDVIIGNIKNAYFLLWEVTELSGLTNQVASMVEYTPGYFLMFSTGHQGLYSDEATPSKEKKTTG